MKKIFLIALAIVAIGFTSCKKAEVPCYYYYTSSHQIVEVTGMPENQIADLERLLSEKSNTVFYLTKAQAQQEWQSFLTATDNMTIFLNEGSFYEVSFDRYEPQGNEMIAVENIGKKHWGI